jgi:hypothetical protein
MRFLLISAECADKVGATVTFEVHWKGFGPQNHSYVLVRCSNAFLSL